jgi:hypothetical protein
VTDHPSPDRMAVAARRVESGNHRSYPILERRLVFALMWLAPCAYYLALLTDGRFSVLQPITLGMAFNDMLAHLLQGRFDVDPAVIGTEGYVHVGRTYSYFGIFCALLRLPLAAFSALRTTDITIASTFVAVCVAWLFRLLALRTVLSRVPADVASPLLVIILVVAFAVQGEGVQFLRPLIYQRAEWRVRRTSDAGMASSDCRCAPGMCGTARPGRARPADADRDQPEFSLPVGVLPVLRYRRIAGSFRAAEVRDSNQTSLAHANPRGDLYHRCDHRSCHALALQGLAWRTGCGSGFFAWLDRCPRQIIRGLLSEIRTPGRGPVALMRLSR